MENKRISGLGIASMVLGIVGLPLCIFVIGVIPCIIGIALSIAAILQKNRVKGMAIAGLSCSVAGLLFFALLWLRPSTETNVSESETIESNQEEIETEIVEEETKDIKDTEGKETETTDNNIENENEPTDKNHIYVGDIVKTDSLKITFLSASEYESENIFMEPKEGYIYYEFSFEFENISDSDESVSSFSFEGYADDYSVDQTWIGEEDLSATLSPGKKVKGSVYFEVPLDSENIIAEYKINFWMKEKLVFVAK